MWGDSYTMRSSKVVKILSPNDIYKPHLYLDNGDTVLFGDIIQKVEESFIDDGLQKQTTDERTWRPSSEYEFIPSEDKKAFRKSISRDSDRFKSFLATARKVAEAHLKKKSCESSTSSGESSNSDESSGESSDSDESSDSEDSINLGLNKMEDINGLILGPKCSQECFMSNKKCHHQKEQVTINNSGDFLAFNATWWHHGYFNHVTELTYFTAQLFCVPSRQLQSTERVHRHTTRLQNYIVGHLDEAIVCSLTIDLVAKRDNNDDHSFSVKKFPPTKKFLGKGIDKSKNRYV